MIMPIMLITTTMTTMVKATQPTPTSQLIQVDMAIITTTSMMITVAPMKRPTIRVLTITTIPTTVMMVTPTMTTTTILTMVTVADYLFLWI